MVTCLNTDGPVFLKLSKLLPTLFTPRHRLVPSPTFRIYFSTNRPLTRHTLLSPVLQPLLAHPCHSFKSTHSEVFPSFLSTSSRREFSSKAKMSDDEADPELLALLREHLQGKLTTSDEPETGVLKTVEHVYNDCIDIAIDMRASKAAAESIYSQMQERTYSTETWSEHELHPKKKDESTVAFIFTMDLLNFSFWSELPDDERFAVEYKGQRWTGYWSLVASMQRALEEGLSDPLPSFQCHGLIPCKRHPHYRSSLLA